MEALDDRVPPGHPVRPLAVPATGPPGAAGAAAGPAARGRSAPDRQGRGGAAGDQPQHRAQGLPGTRTRGPGGRPARGRHVRDGDARRRLARRARPTASGAAALAGQGPQGRSRRGEHRGLVHDDLSDRRSGGHSMTAVIEAQGLGKRYGQRWALSDCTLAIPAGRVVGLVGPNGAGKTTLLNLIVGLLTPTSGSIRVLGGRPAGSPAQLAKVGFVAQDTPTYAGLSIADHLKLGARLNPGWDAALARDRIERLGLDPASRAGKLSGGQRAQLALTLGIAKRPELLILDEPVAALDPLARREFLQGLMEAAAEHELSVVLSSHLVSDLERVCDYLIVLVDSRVRVAGEVEELLATHHRLTGARRDPTRLPADQHVVSASHTDRQTTLIIRTDAPIHDPAWTVSQIGLEDLVLAYMGKPADSGRRGHDAGRRPRRARRHPEPDRPGPGRRLRHRDRRLHHPERRLLELRPAVLPGPPGPLPRAHRRRAGPARPYRALLGNTAHHP